MFRVIDSRCVVYRRTGKICNRKVERKNRPALSQLRPISAHTSSRSIHVHLAAAVTAASSSSEFICETDDWQLWARADNGATPTAIPPINIAVHMLGLRKLRFYGILQRSRVRFSVGTGDSRAGGAVWLRATISGSLGLNKSVTSPYGTFQARY
jgi:hypothetical protein